ncbi:MAG: NapC/NirT family cytochrome c [Anaerolineales bacterium]|jgi:nitrate/TMAO reductase-like tetraheme cytochrome c subunit
MLKRFRDRLKQFFFPPPGSPRWARILPYATLGLLTLLVLIGSAYAWDYTNSPEFCGTACHTMPPEYTSYLTSPHARIDCVECHIGRGFIATRITRKAGDVRHIIATVFRSYEFPITADNMRPARETCERCHFPEKFSDDSLREIQTFLSDENNTPQTIYLTLKTGGGTARLGLGRGIHWHIENEVYFYATDESQQEIPFVQVIESDGTTTEYIDITSDINPTEIAEEELVLMDCITCHNRITHLILQPDDSVDHLLTRGVISTEIPSIRRKAIELLTGEYANNDEALEAIAGLEGYYQLAYPDFAAENPELIQDAIVALQDVYSQSVFPEQRVDWDSHYNNIGHDNSPGCFRCHDGKHMNAAQEAVRLECNVCHSIPVVVGPQDFVAEIEISRGPEPANHLNANWITLHRDSFDESCSSCHTTDNPGGTDNSSFCSNSACHGNAWEYAGFDAPALRQILQSQLPDEEQQEGDVAGSEDLPENPTYANYFGSLFEQRCGSCHGEDGLAGLTLTEYAQAMDGSDNGPVIIINDPDASLIVQKMTNQDSPHFAQLTDQEIDLLIAWIATGAPEE